MKSPRRKKLNFILLGDISIFLTESKCYSFPPCIPPFSHPLHSGLCLSAFFLRHPWSPHHNLSPASVRPLRKCFKLPLDLWAERFGFPLNINVSLMTLTCHLQGHFTERTCMIMKSFSLCGFQPFLSGRDRQTGPGKTLLYLTVCSHWILS